VAITRTNLFGKLNPSLFKSVESATTLCKLRGNPYVELVHWLNQIYQQQDSDIRHIIRHFELDAERLERDFAQALTRLPAGPAPSLISLIISSWRSSAPGCLPAWSATRAAFAAGIC
jgi:ATP-dependent Clp protease ATP-binding subunit ClpA